MGGEFRINQFPQLGNEFPRGQFLFSSQFTNTITPTGPTTATQSGGYTGADFLLGDMNNSIIAVALASADFSNHEWSAHIDDTWRVTPHLTVSLGLRWEVQQPLLDKSGHEVNVELNQPLPNAANVQDLSKHRFTFAPAAGGLRWRGFRYAPYWATRTLARRRRPSSVADRQGRAAGRPID